MKTGWDLNDSNKPEFTKFPEGITKVRIVGEAPLQRWVHFIKRLKISINCPGKGCAICEIRKQEKANKVPYTYPMAKRLAIWAINRETNRLEILENSPTFYSDLKDVMADITEEGKKLIDFDLKVRRKGTDTDTTYRVDKDKEYPLSDADKKLMEGMFELSEYFQPHTIEQTIMVIEGKNADEIFASGDDEDAEVESNEDEVEEVTEEEEFQLK